MRATSIIEVLKVGPSDWNDWRWQMSQQSVCSDLDQLAAMGLVSPDTLQQRRRVGLTPYNVKLLLDLKATDPSAFRAEALQSFFSPDDPGEHQWVWARRHDLHSAQWPVRWPIPAWLRTLFNGTGSETDIRTLENFYPTTDVLVATAVCARHCSFCFREVGDAQGEASRLTGGMDALMTAVQAIIDRKTPHVLVTGGDPLTRSNEQLRQLLTQLVQSPTVQVLRLATRLLVDLPMRFYDGALLTMLREFAREMRDRGASLRIVTQVNHVCELTPEALRAFEQVQACGIEIMNQTVVLRGVNDDVSVLRELLMHLDRIGVRNYKLFHPMPVPGTQQLRVPLRRFRQLVGALHQWLPGTSVPQANVATLVGKIPVAPSGRWMIPIPFTNRVLCRGFRGQWYLFKDMWDMARHLREAAWVTTAVCLLLFASSLLSWSTTPITPQGFTPQLIRRVAVVTDEIDYPDYWARQRFVPFVEEGTLFLPLHGL